MIEAYRIAATFLLNVQPTVAGLDTVLGRYAQIANAQKAVQDGMKGLVGVMGDAGRAAKSYADQMERAARAAAKLASAGMAAPPPASPRPTAAPSQPQPYVSSSTALVPAPRLLPAPQRDFTMQGTPYSPTNDRGQLLLPPPPIRLPAPPTGFETQGPAYGPGRDLVPVGPGRQWDVAGPSPDRGALTIYQAPAGPQGPGTGFTTQGAPYTPQGGDVGPHLGPTGLAPYEPKPMYLPPLPGPRGPFPMGDAYTAAYGAERAGDAAGGLVTGAFNAAASVDALKGALAAQGFTKDQVDAAMKAAVSTQQNVLGSYVGKNLEIIGTLMALTQDADAAIKLMPQAAKTATGFAGLGMGDGVAGLTATLKAAELHGVLFRKNDQGQEVLDQDAVGRFETNMLAMAAISHGNTGPAQILAMMRAAGVSAKMMTDAHGFAEMMPMMTAMGPERAGTGLRGFSQEFSAGKMSQAGMELLEEFGLIHPHAADGKPLFKKLGMGQFQLMPGAMGTDDLEMVRAHPEQFILDRMMPAVQGWLTKEYGDKYTKGNENTKLGFESQAMQMAASRIPGGDFMAQVAANWPLIHRDLEAMKLATNSNPNGPQRDLFATLVDQNPMMRVQGFKASMDALMITLGNDNMATSIATLKSLTSALNHLNDVFIANPKLGADLMGVADGIWGLGKAIGALLLIVGPYIAAKNLVKWAAAPAAAEAGAGGGMLAGAEAAGAGVLKWLGGRFAPILGGMAANSALNWLDPDQKPDQWMDKHIPGYEWADRKLNTTIGGLTDEQFNAARHLTPPAAAPVKTDLTVNLHVDGKLQSSQTIKGITDAANGPLSGIGGFDARRSYTPTEN